MNCGEVTTMEQLVGQKCIFCSKMIGSILDGRFCEECGQPYHGECRPTLAEPVSPATCFSCGGSRPASSVPLQNNPPEGQLTAPPLSPVKRYLRFYYHYQLWKLCIFLVLAGGVCILAGFLLIFDSGSWSNPRQWSIWDLRYGLLSLAVGVAMIGVAIWIVRRK